MSSVRFVYPTYNARLISAFVESGQAPEFFPEFHAAYEKNLRDEFLPAAKRLTPKVTGRLSESYEIREGADALIVRNNADYASYVRFRVPNVRGTRRVVPFSRALLDNIGITGRSRALVKAVKPPEPPVLVNPALIATPVEYFTTEQQRPPGQGFRSLYEIRWNLPPGFTDAFELEDVEYRWTGYNYLAPGEVRPTVIEAPIGWTRFDLAAAGRDVLLDYDVDFGGAVLFLIWADSLEAAAALVVWPQAWHLTEWRVRLRHSGQVGPWASVQAGQPYARTEFF